MKRATVSKEAASQTSKGEFSCHSNRKMQFARMHWTDKKRRTCDGKHRTGGSSGSEAPRTQESPQQPSPPAFEPFPESLNPLIQGDILPQSRPENISDYTNSDDDNSLRPAGFIVSLPSSKTLDAPTSPSKVNRSSRDYNSIVEFINFFNQPDADNPTTIDGVRVAPDAGFEDGPCGNCAIPGHLARDCRHIDPDGYITCCVICDSKEHYVDDCTRMKGCSEAIKERVLLYFVYLKRTWCPPVRTRFYDWMNIPETQMRTRSLGGPTTARHARKIRSTLLKFDYAALKTFREAAKRTNGAAFQPQPQADQNERLHTEDQLLKAIRRAKCEAEKIAVGKLQTIRADLELQAQKNLDAAVKSVKREVEKEANAQVHAARIAGQLEAKKSLDPTMRRVARGIEKEAEAKIRTAKIEFESEAKKSLDSAMQKAKADIYESYNKGFNRGFDLGFENAHREQTERIGLIDAANPTDEQDAASNPEMEIQTTNYLGLNATTFEVQQEEWKKLFSLVQEIKDNSSAVLGTMKRTNEIEAEDGVERGSAGQKDPDIIEESA